MDMMQETDLLRKVPMFAKLDASKLKLLAFTSEMLVFDDGDELFHIGDSADCAYVIMDGAVDVVTETDTGPWGQERIKGGLYGMALNKRKFCQDITLDGACGIESVRKIAKALGYGLQYVSETKNTSTYIFAESEAVDALHGIHG